MRKIFYNENQIIDLSNITVTPETLFSGSRCLNSNGEMINGTAVPLENNTELVKVYVATNHDTYGATGRYTFEFTYADDSGVHTVSCKNGDNSYVMLPTNSVIVEKCTQFSSLGFTQQAANTSSSITTLYSHAIRDSFPYVMFYVAGEGTLYFYTSEAYILWSGLQTIYQWKKYNVASSSGYKESSSSYEKYSIPGSGTSFTNSTYVYTSDSYTFDPKTGKFYLINPTQRTSRDIATLSQNTDVDVCRKRYMVCYVTDLYASAPSEETIATTGFYEIYKIPDTYQTGSSGYIFMALNDYIFCVPYGSDDASRRKNFYRIAASSTTLYSCGSTSYGTVTSTSRNTYPDNNQSDGYWYIYNGTTTEGTTYSLLSAIKVSGNAYINTGITPNNNTRMIMDFSIPSLTAQQALCGSRNGSSSGGFAIFTYDSNAGFQVDYANTQKYPIPASGTYTGRHTLDLNKNVFYLDGTAVHTFTATSFTGSYPIFIGSINNGGSAMTSYPANGLIIYPCKIYSNGTLVRDLVPAQSNTGVVGMFDKCNNVFYTNAGTGSLTAILPEKQLSAIESTGTQYIDTGLIGKSGYRTVIGFSQLQAAPSSGSIGPIGSIGQTGDTRIYPIHYSINTYGLGYGPYIEIPNNPMTIGEFVEFDSTLNAGSQIIKKNGEIIYTGTNTSSINSNLNMYLFAVNVRGTANCFNKIRLYYCKIYYNGTLVRDFVPYRNSSGAVGMYDLVNNVFYANVGTGTFTAIE